MGAIIVTENGTSNTYYTYKDYLGSILTVTNNAGAIVASQSFDAWGRKRNATNGSYDNISTIPDWLYRGYTGHEHLDKFGLINMNGRMYDPVQGRMMSADLFIGDAYSTQGYNMYSYVSNNPLRFVDPSGYLEDVTVTSHPKDNDDNDGDGDYGGGYYGPSMEVPDYAGGTGSGNGGGGPGGGGPGGGSSSSSSNSNNVSKNGVTVRSYKSNIPTVYVQPLVYTEFYITNLVNSLLKPGDGFDSYNVLDEVLVSNKNKTMDNINTSLGAYGLASGIKESVIEGEAALIRGVNISKVNDISLIRSFGVAGARYLKYSKALGVATSIVSTGYSVGKVIDQYNTGGWAEVGSHRDGIDAGIGIVGLGATGLATFGVISNPIGWGIGIGVLVYGGVTLIYDAVNKN